MAKSITEVIKSKLKTKKLRRQLQKRESYHRNKTEISKLDIHISDEAKRKRKSREKIANRREKARDRQKKCRQRKKMRSTPDADRSSVYAFLHRSTKMRIINKFRKALPKTPNKRESALKAYILTSKSPTVKNLQVAYKNEKDTLTSSVFEDIKTVIKTCKTKRTKDALITMNVLVSAVSGENISKSKCVKRLSSEIELPFRRMSGGQRVRTKILKTEQSCWAVTHRKTRSDALNEEDIRTCYNFWISPGMSRPSGNKRDVKRERLGPKIYASHMTHVLEKSQTEVYNEFISNHPNIKISQRQFEKYKPFYVRPVREQDRQTCCCRYHVEANLVFKACKSFRASCLKIHENESTREYSSFNNLSDVYSLTLCEPPKRECYERTCESCGVEKLILFPEEEDISDEAEKVTWDRYEYVTHASTNIKKEHKKLTLVKLKTSPGELFKYFLKLLKTFPAHQHRAVWQHKQFKTLLDNLPIYDCICVHDFSENYRCSERQELQSMYFKRNEVTVHVTIIHRHAVLEIDGVDSTLENPEIVTEAFYVISCDLVHDNVFVKNVQKLVSEYLDSIQYHVKTMHEFTDGCSCQYKSRHCFNDLSTSASTLGYGCLIRNFFETAHAKGPQDAAGGVLKRQADIAILRGTARIQSAQDLFTFACENLQSTKSSLMKRRIFRFLPETSRDDKLSRNVPCVASIRSVHQVINYAQNAIKLRPLSCYSCDNCLDTDNKSTTGCTNTSITGQFRDTLQTTSASDENSNDEVPHDLQSELLGVNMVVAVATEDPDADFYLIRISKEPYQLRKVQKDAWGCEYHQGTVVIGGYFYDKEGYNYKLIKRRPALVPSSSVLYILSEVVGEDTITLSDEMNLNILERLNQLRDIFSYE